MNPDRPFSSRPLVLGVGNLLLGDEGIGVVAIRHLQKVGFGEQVELVDGGTGGFHLLSLFRDHSRIILIDAAADDKPPGTVSLTQPRYASDFPPSLTAHDIGLKDLIESAALLGDLPQVDLITISITGSGPLTMDLSPPVAAALPQVEALVRSCLSKKQLLCENDRCSSRIC
jgi:hydrogenase maturation protease